LPFGFQTFESAITADGATSEIIRIIIIETIFFTVCISGSFDIEIFPILINIGIDVKMI
jgi:hypothetical protein